MPKRGTTLRINHLPAPGRKAPWCCSWNVYKAGTTGRPKTHTAWFATVEEADAFRIKTLDLLAKDAPVPVQPSQQHLAANTLAAFAETVWLPHVKARKAGATYKNYKDSYKNWIAPPKGHKRYPGLGHYILSDATLTKGVVVEYLEGLQKAGISLSRRKRLTAALSACFSYAFFLSRLTLLNPCSKLQGQLAVKGERALQAAPNPYTPDEVTRIFDQLQAVEDLCWRVFFLWQYHVGTRPGEATALKWTALDLANKRAQIEYAYCQVERIDKDPKTHECRSVDLTTPLVELLIEWRQVQREAAFSRGLKQPEYVFTTRMSARGRKRELARITAGGTVQAVLIRTLKACAITGHTLYDFRDSFATSHLVVGWDKKLAWVSKQLGHSTPDVTKKHYYAYRDTIESRTFADEIVGFK